MGVGDGPRLADNRALVRSLDLDEFVTFVRRRHDVLSVIAAADVLAVASDFEGQPLVVVEALALGRPVVATEVGHVPELVGPTVGRTVPPNDPPALAAALLEVLSDPVLRQRMSETASAMAPAWTLHAALDAHERLYEACWATSPCAKPSGATSSKSIEGQ